MSTPSQPWTDKPYDEIREREHSEAEKATRRANAEKEAAQEVQTDNTDDRQRRPTEPRPKKRRERASAVVEAEQDARGNKATRRRIQSE